MTSGTRRVADTAEHVTERPAGDPAASTDDCKCLTTGSWLDTGCERAARSSAPPPSRRGVFFRVAPGTVVRTLTSRRANMRDASPGFVGAMLAVMVLAAGPHATTAGDADEAFGAALGRGDVAGAVELLHAGANPHTRLAHGQDRAHGGGEGRRIRARARSHRTRSRRRCAQRQRWHRPDVRGHSRPPGDDGPAHRARRGRQCDRPLQLDGADGGGVEGTRRRRAAAAPQRRRPQRCRTRMGGPR